MGTSMIVADLMWPGVTAIAAAAALIVVLHWRFHR